MGPLVAAFGLFWAALGGYVLMGLLWKLEGPLRRPAGPYSANGLASSDELFATDLVHIAIGVSGCLGGYAALVRSLVTPPAVGTKGD